MTRNRSKLTIGVMSLFLAIAVAGCGDSDSENVEQTAPPSDLGTSSGSDFPKDAETAAQQHDPILLQWCMAKSGRDETNCACILTAVAGALESADNLILSEVAKADLTEGSTEEAVEAEFNDKYGADRMSAIMETFVSTRAAAEKSCPSSADNNQDPQGT